jgi:hypothetical protein
MFVMWKADRVAWEMAIRGSNQVDSAGRGTNPEHLSQTNLTPS